jgi:hypothetical protein
MKSKLILLTIICFSFFKSYSQDASLLGLRLLPVMHSIDKVESFLKNWNFEFGGTYEDKSDGRHNYVICSFIKATFSNKTKPDVIRLWRQKDSTGMFEMVQYLTQDENLFHKIKNECEQDKLYKKVADKADNNCISVSYLDPEQIFANSFENCLENGERLYKIILLNILFIPDK